MKLGRLILSAIIAAGCIFGMAGCSGEQGSSVGNVGEITFADGDKIAEINIEGYGIIRAKLFPDLAPKGVENFIQLAEQGYYDGLKIHRVLPDAMLQGGSLNGDGTGGTALINEDGVFDIETSSKARHFYGALCYANDLGSNTTQFYIVNNKKPQDVSTIDPAKLTEAVTAYAEQKAGLTEGSPEYNLISFKEKHYTNLAAMLNDADEAVAAKYKAVGGYPMLDGGYTVFGQVFEGLDVVDKISACEITSNASGEKSKPTADIVINSVTITTYVAPVEGEEGETSEDKDDESSVSDSSPEQSDSSEASENTSGDGTAENTSSDSASTDDGASAESVSDSTEA